MARMLPAQTETELKERVAALQPGQWICPCGATIMRDWETWCPHCGNVPSHVPWLARSQAEKARNKRNKSRISGVKCVCEHCGVTFTAKRADSKYHNSSCRQAAYRSRVAKNG